MKTYKFRINGNEYNVDINSVEGNIADVTVNGASYQVEMENAPAPVQKPAQAPATATTAPASSATTTPAPKAAAVKAGQKVAVLEAMKMENEIQAPADGTVTAILVNKGDSVLEGAEIVKIA